MFRDYSVHLFIAMSPGILDTRGIEYVFNIEIKRIQAGDFSDELFESVKLNKIIEIERNKKNRLSKIDDIVDSFILDKKINYYTNKRNYIEDISKSDIINFARRIYNNNYVSIEKIQSENYKKSKFSKPIISPIKINRDSSTYLSNFVKKSSQISIIEPEFTNFMNSKLISVNKISKNIEIVYKERFDNIFELRYVYDIGKNTDPYLLIALDYINMASTKDLKNFDIKSKLYKLGSSYKVVTTFDKIQIIINGIVINFDKTINIIENLIRNFIIEDNLLNLLKKRHKSQLQSDLYNKKTILKSIIEYIKFGDNSYYKRRPNSKMLDELTSEKVLKLIKKIFTMKHRVFFNGKIKLEILKNSLEKIHINGVDYCCNNSRIFFQENELYKKKIYFYERGMSQAEVLILKQVDKVLSIDEILDNLSKIELYNSYFGMGMSSIIFQTLREAKALGYTAYSYYDIPSNIEKEKYYYNVSYLGTQSDKLKDALDCLNKLLADDLVLESVDLSFDKRNLKQKISTNRFIDFDLIHEWERLNKLGLKDEEKSKYYKNLYNNIDNINNRDIINLHKKIKIKDNNQYIIIGSKEILQTLNEIYENEIIILKNIDIFNV